MSKYYTNNPLPQSSGTTKRKRNPWITALIVFASVVGALVIICACALWWAAEYFSPNHIAKIIEDKSSEYLDARISLSKLDYRLFSTYPWLEFEVDSLTVISKSLDNLPEELKTQLPTFSDSLASVNFLKGEINVHDLFHKKINIRSLRISEPHVNIVMVNDTLSNFDIARKIPKMSKVPEMKISEIKVDSPLMLNFFSLQKDLEAKMKVNSFYLESIDQDFYKAGFDGMAFARLGDYSLPDNVPVKFSTTLRPDYRNLQINLRDLAFSLAGISFLTQGEILANKKGIDIRRASLEVKIEDIFSLFSLLPSNISQKIKIPEGISGNIPLQLNLNLLSPYKVNPEIFLADSLNLETLPYLNAEVEVSDANIRMKPPGKKAIEADDIFLRLTTSLDPTRLDETSVEIVELRMHGEGISIDAQASLDNVLDQCQNFRGTVKFSTPLVESLAYFLPKSACKLAGVLKGHVKFDGKAMELGKQGLKNINLNGELLSHNLKVKGTGDVNLLLRNMKSDFTAAIPQYPLNNYAGTSLGFDFSSDSLKMTAGKELVNLADLNLRLDILDTVSGQPDPSGKIDLQVSKINYTSLSSSLTASGLDIKAHGQLTPSANSNYNAIQDISSVNDSIISSRIRHTPLVVEYNGSSPLQTLMDMMTLKVDLALKEGTFSSSSYLYPVDFRGIDVSTNLTDITFSAKDISAGQSGGSINATLEGLGAFLTSYSATPLKADADISFNNVDINKLSWGYFGAMLAQGKDSVYYNRPVKPYTASDSVCVAIPRNIEANIRIKSKAAEYMQYNFSPLSTSIIVKNGDATLKDLTIGAPYCTAVVDWTYSTHDLSDIYMDLKAKVKNFSFTPFYKVFPTLVEKARELDNLSGIINSDIQCRFLMYPDMFMNSPSLEGSFILDGSDFSFVRVGKIERITHLLLIEGDAPLKLNDFKIKGFYHDNLLQINPFVLELGDYKFEAAGINNTAGDMYYHLSLEKSPFHLPFGASIFGNFKHPEFRLGGTHMDDYRGETVAAESATQFDVNIMAWLQHGWNLFIQEAAKYEGKLWKETK